MISKQLKEILFLEMHKVINDTSSKVIKNLTETDLQYPPGINLTKEERMAIVNLNLSIDAKSALEKIMLNASAYPIFHLLSLMDGICDPEYDETIEWYGLTLSEKDEFDTNMMHDEFYESYNLYRNNKH